MSHEGVSENDITEYRRTVRVRVDIHYILNNTIFLPDREHNRFQVIREPFQFISNHERIAYTCLDPLENYVVRC